jgi:hypothetical protein
MDDLQARLAALLAARDQASDPRAPLLDAAEMIARAAADAFQRRPDEVGILVAGADGRYLRFAAPRRLSDLGTIPLTKRESIAVGVFSRKTGEASNNVPVVRHVAFFEAVKVADRVDPIQKMVTVPILLPGGPPVGVAQISKKGETLGDAGPDFTPMDVQRIQAFFAAHAETLAAARPKTF